MRPDSHQNTLIVNFEIIALQVPRWTGSQWWGGRPLSLT